VLQAPEQRFPCNMQTTVRQAIPLQPMEVHGGADLLLQPVQDSTPEQMNT